MFPIPENNSKKISNITGSIIKIQLDTSITTSLYGDMGIRNDMLYFMDNLFCTYYEFDTTGKFINKALGQGRGPTETIIGQIATHAFMQNGELCLMGGSDDVYIYDKNLKKKLTSGYRKTRKQYKRDEKIGYDQFELYSLGYPLICRSYNDRVFTNNDSEHSQFNYFETPDIFVQEFRCITEQEVTKKQTGRLLGKGMPDMFKNTSDKHYLFAAVIFDVDKDGNFYVSYRADSLIYKYDKNFSPVYSFGWHGNKMDIDYLSITQIKDIRERGIDQWNTKGYYTWIEYIDELDYLLRSYTKGDKQNSDGLQIYKNGILLSDISIPKGFKPMGYIKPYLYSQHIIEGESLFIYKIKI